MKAVTSSLEMLGTLAYMSPEQCFDFKTADNATDIYALGSFQFENELELIPRLGLHCETEYNTREQWEGKVQLAYLISKDFSMLANWHSEYGIGQGAASSILIDKYWGNKRSVRCITVML